MKKHIDLYCHSYLAISNGDMLIQGCKEDPRVTPWTDIWIKYWDKRKRKVLAPCFIGMKDIEYCNYSPPEIGETNFMGDIIDENYRQWWIQYNNDKIEFYRNVKNIVEIDGYHIEHLSNNLLDIYVKEDYITREVAEKYISKCFFNNSKNLKFNWKRSRTIVSQT